MRVGALYAILRLETGAFHSALGHAESRWSRFGGVLKAGGLLAAQGIALVGAASLAMAASFEQHMNESLAIMSGVTDAMRDRMEEAARAIAKSSTFSANEAADAFFYLAGAGYDAEQSIAALPVVTQFAQAGMMDLERATEMLMNAQMAMNLRSDDAQQNMLNMTRISDVLTAAQIESTATLEQMSEALLNKAAPALRLVNKDVEEGAAALMVLANQGLKGQAAGTGLAIVLRELQTKAIANKDAWVELGVATYDADGNMRHLADIIGDLEGALAGMSDEQQRAILGQLGFTDRSLGFIQAMLGSSDALREYDTMLREAAGTTEEVANKQLDTFQAQLQITWHKIQDVALSIGEKLLPGAKNMIVVIGNWIDANHDLIVAIAVGFVDAVGRAIEMIGTFIGMVVQIAEKVVGTRDTVAAFGDLIRSIFSPNGEHIDGLRKYMEQYDLLDDRIVDVTETMLGVLRPAFDAVHGAVSPVAEAVANIITNLGEFRDLVVSVFSPDGDALNGVRQYMDAFEDLDPVVIEVMETIGTKVSETFTFLAEEVFPPLQEAIGVLIEDYVKYLGAQWLWITDEILPRLIELLNVVAEETIPMVGDGFNWLTDEVIPALSHAFNAFIDEVLPALQEAFAGIITWFEENWPLISKVAGQVFGAVGTLVTVMAHVIWGAMLLIWAVVEPVARVLLPLLGAAASFLLEVMSAVFTGIGILWQQFADAAVITADAVMWAFGQLGEYFEGLFGAIVSQFKSFINLFIDIINSFLHTLNSIAVGIPPIDVPLLGRIFPGASVDPFNFPLLPRLASGTTGFPGGVAMLGEEGPELAFLPRGTAVLPSDVTAALMNGGGGKTEYHRHHHVTVQGAREPVKMAEDVLPVLQRLDYLDVMRRGSAA